MEKETRIEIYCPNVCTSSYGYIETPSVNKMKEKLSKLVFSYKTDEASVDWAYCYTKIFLNKVWILYRERIYEELMNLEIDDEILFFQGDIIINGEKEYFEFN